MTTIVTRAGKGSPLTHTEVDTNFTNLNTNKLEAGAIALGSAATPSISFTGDTNTGIYSPGADQVAVATNGTGRLFVDASGSVGLGTSQNPTAGGFSRPVLFLKQFTDPAAGFGGVHIEASGDQSVLGIGYDGTAQVFAFDTSYRGTGARRPIVFKTTGAECMRIDSAGLVGIGTSSPGTRLDVISTASASTAIARFKSGTSAGDRGVEIASDSNYNVSIQGIRASDNTTGYQLAINPSGGNVGIGTTSPGDVLDTAAGNYRGITIKCGTTAHRPTLSFFNTTDSLAAYIQAVGSSLTFGTMATDYGSHSEKARIDSSGRLLIGTTTAVLSSRFLSQYDGNVDNGAVLNETANTSNTTFLGFSLSGTLIGSVIRVGATSAVVYNTTSDYRLKTIIGSVTGQGERIDALKPIDFQWKENGQQARGFLAHEFQEVYANSVTGKKDAVDANGNPVYQAMQASTSEIIADLVAEIQSLRARVADLEAS